MPNNADYKSKYLDLLDKHEQASKQQTTQVSLLKKAIFNLSVAAKEQDPQLDASIIALQENLKGAQGFKVYESIEKLQKTVLAFDEKKEHRREKSIGLLLSFIKGLQSLSPTKEIDNQLTINKKALKNSQLNHTEMIAVLEELNVIHKKILQHVNEKKPSLWDKLKISTHQADKDANLTHENQALVREADDAFLPDPAFVDATPSNPTPTNPTPTNSTPINPTPINPELAIRSTHLDNKQDYCEAITQHISATLTELVTHIEPTDEIQHKMDDVVSRLSGDIDYAALADIVDDIRDILMARYLRSDSDFSHYLKSLNDELNSIGSTLGIAKERGLEHAAIAKGLSHTVSSQVETISNSVNAEDKDLNTIQHEVNSNIATIREALTQFDAHQSTQEQNLTEQLESLLEQVKRIEKDAENSRKQLEEQRHKATHDTLTGLPNREAYNQRIFFEVRRFFRYHHPLTIVVCDIDHFKSVNDTIGHQAGDKVLKLVARLLCDKLREVDFIARYGGEEFVIIMPETHGETALSLLEDIREAIFNMPLKFKQNPISISMCFGIKEFNSNDTAESAFEAADQALYRAKENGRNRCIQAHI